MHLTMTVAKLNETVAELTAAAAAAPNCSLPVPKDAMAPASTNNSGIEMALLVGGCMPFVCFVILVAYVVVMTFISAVICSYNWMFPTGIANWFSLSGIGWSDHVGHQTTLSEVRAMAASVYVGNWIMIPSLHAIRGDETMVYNLQVKIFRLWPMDAASVVFVDWANELALKKMRGPARIPCGCATYIDGFYGVDVVVTVLRYDPAPPPPPPPCVAACVPSADVAATS
jgi:hypothetical protein